MAGGQALEADLTSPQGVRVRWRAELRDGAHYIRQTVSLASPQQPFALHGVEFADLRLPSLATIGTASAQIETYRLHQQTTREAQVAAQMEAAKHEAFQLVPELADPESPETAQALQILGETPELRSNPKCAVILAQLVVARRAQGVRPQPPLRPQPAVRRATPAPGSPSAGAPAADPQLAIDQAYEDARKSGNVRNFARLLSVTRAPRVA